MALVKKHKVQDIEELPIFSSLEEVIEYYKSNDGSKKDYAIEEMVKFDTGAECLVSLISPEHTNKSLLTKIASVISSMNAKEAPIESIWIF